MAVGVCARRGQHHLQLVLLAALQQRRALGAAAAVVHLHLEQRCAEARHRRQRVQPGAAGSVGACPQRQRVRAGEDSDLGVGRRAALRVMHDQCVALVHIACAHRQLRARTVRPPPPRSVP